MNRKVVFIGGGSMAEGMIGGLIEHKVFRAEDIIVNDILPERLDYLQETYKITPVGDGVASCLKDADMAILAVRPQDIRSAAEKLKGVCRPEIILLSICAGVTLKTLEDALGSDKKILKVMPNTQIKAHSGYSAACVNQNITGEDKEFITEFLNALGQALYIDEGLYDTFTAYSCTGPFYIYKFIEALIDAGVHAGFSRKDARNMVAKNLVGVARTFEATDMHPAAICDTMTSPGGVSIEALQSMCENGFAGIIMNTVDTAVKKANSLG